LSVELLSAQIVVVKDSSLQAANHIVFDMVVHIAVVAVGRFVVDHIGIVVKIAALTEAVCKKA
jgi:hypothetical protein